MAIRLLDEADLFEKAKAERAVKELLAILRDPGRVHISGFLMKELKRELTRFNATTFEWKKRKA